MQQLMRWVGLGLMIGFAALVLAVDGENFVKWKPSVLYWALGTAMWLSPLVFGRNLLQSLLGQRIGLSARVWHRLNFAWIAYLAAMGLINLWVAYSFSTGTWLDFTLFGGLGLTLAFTLAQGLVFGRASKDDPSPATEAGQEGS